MTERAGNQLLNSCFYPGKIMHQRYAPKQHRFTYRVFCMLLDLDELQSVNKYRFFSLNRFNLLSFYERDHGRGDQDIAGYVKQLLTQRGFGHASARIELLCYPRILGYVFNPLSIYFCYDEQNTVQVILYEVTNTFGERHSYLLTTDGINEIQQSCHKALYVSPFMPENGTYAFDIKHDHDRLKVLIKLFDHEKQHLLTALLSGSKCAFNHKNIRNLFLSHPLMTLKVVFGIHWQALQLWLKKVKVVDRQAAPKHSISWQDAQGKKHYESL